MITEGSVVTSYSGRKIRIGKMIAPGGQGIAFWATDLDAKQKGVAKFFLDGCHRDNTIKRIHFLVDQKLGQKCEALKAPIDPITNGYIGHFSPVAPGKSLVDFLSNPNATFMELLILAVALCHSIAVVHKQGMSHGDINSSNALIVVVPHTDANIPHISLIDFDNFYHPQSPLPICLGQIYYMAPEMIQALQKRGTAIPDIYADLFSLAVLLHEIILQKHILFGVEGVNDTMKFYEAMSSGRWYHDPLCNYPLDSPGGLPPQILNTTLARLFRMSFSLVPSERPSAEEWETALCQALKEVFICESCGKPNLIDPSKDFCPWCRQSYPTFGIVLKNGEEIPLDRGSVSIGRDELGGSQNVSARHCVFKKIGPEVFIEPVGSNPTYQKIADTWVKLPNYKPVLIGDKDNFRLAETEIYIQKGSSRLSPFAAEGLPVAPKTTVNTQKKPQSLKQAQTQKKSIKKTCQKPASFPKQGYSEFSIDWKAVLKVIEPVLKVIGFIMLVFLGLMAVCWLISLIWPLIRELLMMLEKLFKILLGLIIFVAIAAIFVKD